jgi:hypothetical protein
VGGGYSVLLAAVFAGSDYGHFWLRVIGCDFWGKGASVGFGWAEVKITGDSEENNNAGEGFTSHLRKDAKDGHPIDRGARD